MVSPLIIFSQNQAAYATKTLLIAPKRCTAFTSKGTTPLPHHFYEILFQFICERCYFCRWSCILASSYHSCIIINFHICNFKKSQIADQCTDFRPISILTYYLKHCINVTTIHFVVKLLLSILFDNQRVDILSVILTELKISRSCNRTWAMSTWVSTLTFQ